MKKLRNLSVEEELEIIEKIKTKKRKDIIVEYGISDRHYKNVLNKHGIQLKDKVQKYSFNENYFEKIDTEDKAYFLGFIVADGCINNKYNSISIIQKEIDILHDFKNYIEFTGNITRSNKRDISSISISSAKTKLDLYNLGISSNKTMVVEYPKIPEHLQSHFMRGVFDGDGCISLRTDKRDGHQRGQFNICSGSINFIKDYYNKLVSYCNLSGKNKIRCPKGTYYVVDFGGLSDIEKIYEFLYKNSKVYLKRKKETFEKIVSITKNKNRYRKCQ